MLRFVLSVVALAGVLVTAQPTFADPLAAATSDDHVQAAAPESEQPTRPAVARASSPDATAPANAGLGKGVIPVGFGWG
jgi:hypothetical protein